MLGTVSVWTRPECLLVQGASKTLQWRKNYSWGLFLSQPQAGQGSSENALAHSWFRISSNEALVSKDLCTQGQMDSRYSRRQLRLSGFMATQGEGPLITRIQCLTNSVPSGWQTHLIQSEQKKIMYFFPTQLGANATPIPQVSGFSHTL